MINVIIADDHKIVVDGLVSILENENDINIVGVAINGEEVFKLLKEEKIDIAILDIEMPGYTGVQLSQYISKQYPNIKILILTMYRTQEFVNQILSIGAKGYILKNKGSDELVKAIRAIYNGQSYIGQEITEVLIEALKDIKRKKEIPLIKLTKREKEVLGLIVKGYTSNQIGQQLFIAPSTVDTHRKNLIDKTGVANSKELIYFSLENKLV